MAYSANSTLAGYLTTELNDFGEYGYTSTNVTEALQVSFSYDPTSPSGIEITAVNGLDAAAPLFGLSKSLCKIFGKLADGAHLVLVAGFASTSDDLATGSSKYAKMHCWSVHY